MAVILIVMSHLVEVIFVELAHEAGEVAVLKVFRQDRLGESFVLRRESVGRIDERCPFTSTSSTTKLPPSSPHRTT